MYINVVEKFINNSFSSDIMFVAGATHIDKLVEIRATAVNNFLLIPGFGAQGGNLADIYRATSLNGNPDILVNASRSIIYSSNQMDFAEKAQQVAKEICLEMEILLNK